ncbi:MAG: hypothetical protein DRN78_04490 [Thermoproteota archaeon]|nr:MAG: hypothetical protein DRN78_04490 [Candidatus Korarchaeota archaeon]
MPRCPICGRWFRSNKGLKTHMAKVHSMKAMADRMMKAAEEMLIGPRKKSSGKRRKRRKR